MAKGEMTITLDEREWTKIQILLSEYSEIDQNRIIKSALAKGGQDLKTAGQSNLSQTDKGTGSGQLKKSFTIRKRNSKKKGSFTLVGFKRGPSYKEHGGSFAHLPDRGTKKRSYITKTGKEHYTGSISANAPNTGSEFWTNAVETEGPRALNTIVEAIYDALIEINNRNCN